VLTNCSTAADTLENLQKELTQLRFVRRSSSAASQEEIDEETEKKINLEIQNLRDLANPQRRWLVLEEGFAEQLGAVREAAEKEGKSLFTVQVAIVTPEVGQPETLSNLRFRFHRMFKLQVGNVIPEVDQAEILRNLRFRFHRVFTLQVGNVNPEFGQAETLNILKFRFIITGLTVCRTEPIQQEREPAEQQSAEPSPPSPKMRKQSPPIQRADSASSGSPGNANRADSQKRVTRSATRKKRMHFTSTLDEHGAALAP